MICLGEYDLRFFYFSGVNKFLLCFPEIEFTDEILHYLPSDLQNELKVVGKRVNPEKMKEIVKRLCAIQPWKLPELAQLLRRHANYIRQNYLLPLIESDELEYLFPHQPNHPQQAYRTKK